jgi:mannose-6-phosphate isomerase-like protein (cupin superfamily)
MDDVTDLRGRKIHRQGQPGFAWDGVDRLTYRQDARACFRAISRQVLFSDPNLMAELRYFEVAPGGFSTLERHQHVHAVLVLRGRGHCLVGTAVMRLEPHDLINVPPWAWHQFRATLGEPLGFLCLVNAERDKPQLPSGDELAHLQAIPEVAAFFGNSPPNANVKA